MLASGTKIRSMEKVNVHTQMVQSTKACIKMRNLKAMVNSHGQVFLIKLRMSMRVTGKMVKWMVVENSDIKAVTR
jgi:hypothetical protein